MIMKVSVSALIALFLLQWEAIAKTPKKGKRRSKSGFLYEVTLPKGIFSTKIRSIVKERPILNISKFRPLVKPGEIFLVIHPNRKNIVAELSFYQLSKNKKLVSTDVTRIAPGLTANDLLKFETIRLRDLAGLLDNVNPGKDLTTQTNPIISLSALAESYVMALPNFSLGASLYPFVISSGWEIALFFPKISKLPQLNWIGIQYSSTSIVASTITIQKDELSTQQASLSGSSSNLHLTIIPTYPFPWMSKLKLTVGIVQERDEEVAIEGPDQLTSSKEIWKMTGTGGGVGCEFHLVSHTFVGFEYWPSYRQDVEIDNGDGIDPLRRKWWRSDLTAWIRLEFPFKLNKETIMNIQGILGMSQREDQLKEEGNVLIDPVIDYRTFASLGLTLI